MDFGERRKIHILNSVALAIGVLSATLTLMNLSQGKSHLLPYNLAMTFNGFSALVLLWRGRWRTAIVTLSIIGITVSALQGLLVKNGVEINFIAFGILMTFLMDSAAWRIPLLLASLVGYVTIQGLHFEFFTNAGVSQGRFVTNIAIGLVTTYIYCEVFRRLSDDYRALVERKNLDLEAQRAALDRANEAKDRLFALVTHDLRGPVTRLKDSVDHLVAGRLTPERFESIQGVLRSDIHQLHASMESILRWASSQMAFGGDPVGGIGLERVALGAAADEALALFAATAREKGIALRNGIAPEAAVRADPGRFQAVLRNLISNALKFTAPGGSVSLAARSVAGQWEIAVADTGSGPGSKSGAAAVRAILEGGTAESTWGTGGEQGFGLGLRLCRDFVLAQGGTIRAEEGSGDGSGGGTTVVVTLSGE